MTLEKINRQLINLIKNVLNKKLKMKLQKIVWISLSNIYIINGKDNFKMVESGIKCGFIPITMDNCHRVADFREANRITEYRDKLARKEIGYFAEYNNKMIGSVWATINKSNEPCVIQTFKIITNNEGFVHDTVVSEKFRGMRIGPFMESRMFLTLINKQGPCRIITDANIRNRAAIRMKNRQCIRVDRTMLYVALLGKPILRLVLRKYN